MHAACIGSYVHRRTWVFFSVDRLALGVLSKTRKATNMRMVFAILVFALGLTGHASASANERMNPAWHPMVFNMIESWISDVESPVVTEINLDAVRRNRNQFDRDEVKQDGEWVGYRVSEGGFRRYRVIEYKENYYKVEYQDNGGGSLTTNARIGFKLERREMLVDGKPKVINVLRVLSYAR